MPLHEQRHKQPLPSSVPKHEEEDAEYDARDADVDPDDDASCGGLIVLLILHAVARGIQHCQKKGGEGVGGAVFLLLLQLLVTLGTCWEPRKAVTASTGLEGP